MPTITPPRIFAVCQSCYRNEDGDFVGHWVEARYADTITAEHLHNADIHGRPATNECHDVFIYDGDWDHVVPPLRSIPDAVQCGLAYEQLDRRDWRAWCALGRREERVPTVTEFRNRYYGQWDSQEEFIRHLTADRELHSAAKAGPQTRDFTFIDAGDDDWFVFAN